jgi:hypothetical protein
LETRRTGSELVERSRTDRFHWLVVCGHKDPFSIKRAAQVILEGHPHHKSVAGSTELLETLSDKVHDPGGSSQTPPIRLVAWITGTGYGHTAALQ